MKVYLKENQPDAYAIKKEYKCIGESFEIQHQQHTYKVLTYSKKISGLARLGRIFAGVLSYLTIIPLFICRGRINELFQEAKSKREIKIVHIPLPTRPDAEAPDIVQQTFDNLKNQIALIKSTPQFIKTILGEEPSQDNNKKLAQWLHARNQLILWSALIEQINKNDADSMPVEDLTITKFKTLEKTVNKASEFNVWLIKNKGTLKNLTTLTTLKGKQLTEIPKPLSSLMPKLTTLDLQENLLTDLGDEFANFKALKRLDLRKNQFVELPDSLFELKTLTHLYLGRNRLGRLSPNIGELKALAELNLAQNRLNELPAEIGELGDLKILVTEGNKNLEELPNELEALIVGGNLQVLYTDKETREANEGLFEAAKEKGVKIDRVGAKATDKNGQEAMAAPAQAQTTPQGNQFDPATLARLLQAMNPMQQPPQPQPQPQPDAAQIQHIQQAMQYLAAQRAAQTATNVMNEQLD